MHQKTLRRRATAALALLAACAPTPTPAPTAAALPRTRAERTTYLETTTYADMLAFVDSLRVLGAPISVSQLATSPMGKSVPLVVASRPLVRTPAEARRLGRPVVYLQANIHAGEVEGKEAVLALLREWSFGARPNVLDSLVVVVVPMYNTDGNDKLAAQARNRGAQNGPEMIGERPNGAGLDLNRDYVKAEAPETNGALAALNAWEPDLFMDLHTTNGSYHGYALTYSPSLHPAAPLAPFTADTLLPEIRRRMKAKHNFEVFPYGNFTGSNGRESITADTKSGWATYEHKQRYGTNYVGLRGGISILSEAYSHDPFERRVASTRAFVQEILSYVAEDRRRVTDRVRAGVAAATFGAGVSTSVPVRARFTTRPETQEVLVERLDRLPDSTRLTQPGVPRGIQRSGVITAQRMPVVDRFEASLNRPASAAGYAISGDWPKARQLLEAHGVPIRVLTSAVTVALQEFVIDTVVFSGRPFQGHREVSVGGRWREATRELPAGSLVVPSGTRRDLLAMLLLEPESDDGLLTWNVFDSVLEKGKVAPVVRLAAPLR
ncbi:M14 family metallopeptidase [Gemmatimonas phototrophica]|uniref:M14 family metallopeptidase n=1 Tax=Gemmatimonas phototrophica TaxID=1379270 RepID=UPI0006A6E304|nr:M14 family metallopeptidase [Gemmatimonas phototrophica]